MPVVMPDAIKSLLEIEAAPKEKLSKIIYNVTSFSPSAQEMRDVVLASFPQSSITFEPHLKRQDIVDTWPADIDDSAAREDWGWSPDYDQQRSFNDYLIPAIRQRYAQK